MIDVNDIAALLHVEEKLRGHPQFRNMHAAVMAKLDEHELAHKGVAEELRKKAAEKLAAEAAEKEAEKEASEAKVRLDKAKADEDAASAQKSRDEAALKGLRAGPPRSEQGEPVSRRLD